jgi:hypothetical protein
LKTKLTILLLLFGIAQGLFAQSTSLKKLREERKHNLHLYFYPSSIRMLNVNKDEQFYELVKDLKNIRFLNYADSPELRTRMSELKNELFTEGYEELMIMRHTGMNVQLLAHSKRSNQLVALAQTQGSWYVLDVSGKINPLLLNQQWQKGFDLGPLQGFLDNQQQQSAYREKMKQARQEAEKAYQDELNQENFENSTTDPTAN